MLVPLGWVHPLFLPGNERKPAREEGQYVQSAAGGGEGRGAEGG